MMSVNYCSYLFSSLGRSISMPFHKLYNIYCVYNYIVNLYLSLLNYLSAMIIVSLFQKSLVLIKKEKNNGNQLNSHLVKPFIFHGFDLIQIIIVSGYVGIYQSQ